MSVRFERQFKEALNQIVNAAVTLRNINVAENTLPVTEQNLWVLGEVEKLDEVSASILKHLSKD